MSYSNEEYKNRLKEVEVEIDSLKKEGGEIKRFLKKMTIGKIGLFLDDIEKVCKQYDIGIWVDHNKYCDTTSFAFSSYSYGIMQDMRDDFDRQIEEEKKDET
jgi:hypothetical protein